MSERELVLAGACVVVVVLVLSAVAALHERHYRERRNRVAEARHRGLELRLAAVEQILVEDRLT